jgi:hypothetical protein
VGLKHAEAGQSVAAIGESVQFGKQGSHENLGAKPEVAQWFKFH